jgi:putative endonuclease
MYFIYILYSEKSDKYYVGHTDDVNQRLEIHNNSDRITYTSKHRPWKIMAVYECGTDRGDALKIERFIKRQKNRKLIQKLIDGGKFEGVLAQLVRVPHVRD